MKISTAVLIAFAAVFGLVAADYGYGGVSYVPVQSGYGGGFGGGLGQGGLLTLIGLLFLLMFLFQNNTTTSNSATTGNTIVVNVTK